MLLYTIPNITMVPKREKNVFWQCLNTFTFLLKSRFLVKYFSSRLLLNFSLQRSFLVKHFSCRLLLNLCFFFHLGLKVESSHSAPENDVMLQIQRMRYRSYFHQKASIGLTCLTFWSGWLTSAATACSFSFTLVSSSLASSARLVDTT